MQQELLDVPFAKGSCIIVPVLLYSSNSRQKIEYEPTYFILDTGATTTHVSKSFLNHMGYKNSAFTKDIKQSLSTMGSYTATLCRVQRLNFCNVAFNNCKVKVWDVPKDYHVDGVLGMDILRYFNIDINTDIEKATITQSNNTKSLLKK